MDFRLTALRAFAAVTFLLATVGTAQAILMFPINVPIAQPLSSLTASGNGSVPFGSNLTQVDSSFTATLNPGQTSGIFGSFDLDIVVNMDGTATASITNADIDVDLWLQMDIIDSPGGASYAPSLGSSLNFIFDTALHGDLTGNASASFDPITGQIISETENFTYTETPLSFSAPLLDTMGNPVDLDNANGNDTVTMGLSGLDLLAFNFDILGGEVTATIDALILTGEVNPPFLPPPGEPSIVLSTSSQQIPAPTTLALLAIGLTGLGWRRRSSAA